MLLRPHGIQSQHLAVISTHKGTIMKTSTIEVRDMLSVFGVDEVEKHIGEVPGVHSVTVNFAASNATVRYDETQLEATDIKSAVRQRGHDASTAAGTAPGEGHAEHAPTAAPSEPPKGAEPTSAQGAPAADGPADAAAPPDEAPTTKN